MMTERKGNVSTTLIILLVILGVIFMTGFLATMMVIGIYNGIVDKDVATEKAWGNVETAYQRRIDLIPNLVETVKGVANFEQETYIAVTEARTKWLSAGTIEEKMDAGNELNSALGRLLVTVENYPQLKANQNFLALQDELAGTENRIKWERDNYNQQAAEYKKYIRKFPNNIVAGIFGFEQDKWELFESDEDASEAPEISFE